MPFSRVVKKFISLELDTSVQYSDVGTIGTLSYNIIAKQKYSTTEIVIAAEELTEAIKNNKITRLSVLEVLNAPFNIRDTITIKLIYEFFQG